MRRRSDVGPGLMTRIVKQTIDIIGATAVLVVASPLMAGLAAAIWLTMGRPILYRQMRPGLHERPFRVWKFRTMTEARDAEGHLLPDGERLTALGRWLREWSLDELPQFVNVLKGDMSLVGPRPLLLRYLNRYTPRQRLRHDVKPGITGWAQVNGRNAADWDTRLEHDVWYAENVSLTIDCRILLLTVSPSRSSEAMFSRAPDRSWTSSGAPSACPNRPAGLSG